MTVPELEGRAGLNLLVVSDGVFKYAFNLMCLMECFKYAFNILIVSDGIYS